MALGKSIFGRGDLVRIKENGKLLVQLEDVSSNSRIFRGLFSEKALVAVRRYWNTQRSQYEKELDVLLAPVNLDENFIRFMAFEESEDHESVFIAVELCLCSIEDLYRRPDTEEESWISQVKKTLDERSILRQVSEGLLSLHGFSYLHCSLKPSNFLIAEIPMLNKVQYRIKISDFRHCRKLPEESDNVGMTPNDGWTSPEFRDQGRILTWQFDTFVLGCLFYYVLNDGTHPFGSSERERLANICNRDYHVYKEKWKPQCTVAMIKVMLHFDPSKRPNVMDVLRTEPYFCHLPHRFSSSRSKGIRG